MAEETRALATLDGQDGMVRWQLMRDQAAVFVKSGLLPAHVKTPEQAVVIMLKGAELGLPPLYALSTISVIGGKPVVAAEVMAALIYRHHGDQALRPVQSDDQGCTVEYRRRNWPAPQSYTFTIEDAKRAGLLGNQTWQKYPAAMCRARCISAVARMAFPDCISGVYTEDEMSTGTVEDAAMVEVIDAPTRPVQTNGHTVDTTTGEVLAEDDLPAPAKWMADLRAQRDRLYLLSQERIEIDEPMTRGIWKQAKAYIKERIAEAEADAAVTAGDI